LKHLFAGYVALAVAIGAAAIIAPELVYTENRAGFTDFRLRGDLIANTGTVAATGLVLALGYPKVIKRRAVHAAIVAGFFVLLVLALTRSGWAVLLAFLLLAIVRLPSSKPLYYFLYGLLVSIPVALMFQGSEIIERWIVRDPESLTTMSARIPLWQYTLSQSMEISPWIGVGFYANRYITTSYLADIGTSHGSYVEVLSGGGIVSFVAFSAMLIVELILAARLFLSYGKDPAVFTVVALLVGTLLLGVTSESMLVGSGASFVFYVLLSLIPAVARTVRSQAQRGASGTSFDGSFGSQSLPATRR
jgi:O-antigen ligase